MTFVKIKSNQEVASYIAGRLKQSLAENKKVLWLLSGGSAIEVEAIVAKSLGTCDTLVTSLVDERYGPLGHKDSNARQLANVGINLDRLNFTPVLADNDVESTVSKWQDKMAKELEKADYVLAIAGIGADGHTLGIKPKSPAVDSSDLAVGYKWDDYERVTLTGRAVDQIDEIVVYAMGSEKKPQLERLREDISPSEQPAQLLKQCAQLKIFNDQLA